MLFWIPLGVVCLLLILGFIWMFIEDDPELLGGMTAIAALIVVVMGFVSIGVVGAHLHDNQRILSHSQLAPIDSKGDYIKLTFTGKGELATYNKIVNGVAVPFTSPVAASKAGADRSSNENTKYITSTKDGAAPEYAQVQYYLDAPLLWPWLVEGDSTIQLRVPAGSVATK